MKKYKAYNMKIQNVLKDINVIPIQTLEQIFSGDLFEMATTPLPNNERSKKGPKDKGTITNCPHADRKPFSQGMCNYCYHAYGRSKKATDCPHPERFSYAHKKCMSCYQKQKNMMKNELKEKKQENDKVTIKL